MSKITTKNLSYDSSLPPFLQRMQSSVAGSSDGRHERAIARPKRARTAQDDEDDEPAYVDESTNHTLSREEYKELVGDKDAEAGDGVAEGVGAEGTVNGEKEGVENVNGKVDGKDVLGREKLAGIGGARKRKQGRVVGEEEGDGDGGIAAAVSKAAALAGDVGKEKEKGAVKKGDGKKEKKKSKKIKLSFGDEEG